MEKNIKERVRENFQTMEFTVAMKANEELREEYIRVFGNRSWNSMVNVYKRKAKTEEVIKPEDVGTLEFLQTDETPADETSAEENKTETLPVEELPVEEERKQEDSDADFFFTPKEKLDIDNIESLVDCKATILEQFCIIHEYYHMVSDTQTIRFTNMYVNVDGKGWKLYDEGSAAAKSAGLKSYTKLGFFDKSEHGFPVGEEYSQITVMRIRKALCKFVLERTGITRVTEVQSI